jgi:3-phenylpropionate/trans-cinnamate dioxygenase ferredoxin reductase subunit
VPAYKYLIIGGGMTADSAVRGIRQLDKSGSIGLVTSEPHPPYNRPPLSKGLWKGDPVEKIWRTTSELGAEMHLECRAKRIDPGNKMVLDDHGTEYRFEKLLLATGGKVRRLPFEVEGIIYFRTLDDFHRLETLAGQRERFVVIGGGFIGSEVAAALTMNKKQVTMIFPEEGIGARVYPRRLSSYLNSFYQSKGVTVLAEDGVSYIEKRNSSYLIRTTKGQEVIADGVVAGIGIQPDVELAQAAGLKVENGIHVDEHLRTSHPDIFAAGDVANFYNPALGKRIRVEHEDNANTMGNAAGKNMAGERIPYVHLPFFYSDLFELGYEAIGELDSRYEVVEDGKQQFAEGVVYYLEGKRVRGVLLWNTWGQVDNARALIAKPGPFAVKDVLGRLPA